MQYIRTQIAKDLGLYKNGLQAATPGSAGIDLYAAMDYTIELGGASDAEAFVHTGIHIWGQDAHKAIMLLPRSSSQYQMVNTVGLIDSDYQGELIFRIRNPFYDRKIVIKPGDKFGQFIQLSVVPAYQMNAIEVEEFEYVTKRNAGGFGSTGV